MLLQELPSGGGINKPPAQPQPATQAQTGGSASSNVDPIPGSSVYLGESNAALQAYQNAQSQLLSQRNSLYHQYGLLENGSVDPNNQFGDYQELLGSEGANLDAADNAALGRGLGTGGLAMQGESALKASQGAEQLGFQRNVDQAGSDYANGLENASGVYSGALNTAYFDAVNAAIAAGAFTPAATNTDTPDGSSKTTSGVSDTKVPTSASAAKATLAKQLAARKSAATVKGRVISIH